MELTKFLIAHCHVVEDLQCNEFITVAFLQVYNVKNPVCFLKQEQGVVKLLLLNIDKSTFVEL